MPERLRFLLLYFLAWIGFFEVARLFFLLAQWSQLRGLSLHTTMASFWYGARMDASMAAYLCLPVSVFLLASFFIPFFRKSLLYRLYTGLLLLPVLLLVVSDVEVYKQWGFRMDATPLKYLSSPKEAWASVSHLPVFWYALLLVILFAAFLYGSNRLLRRMCIRLQQAERPYTGIATVLIATGALIIPLRGGLQQTPLNQSSVYFSNSNFANQAALNVPWNFLFGVLSETAAGSESNPYNYMPVAEATQIADSLYEQAIIDPKPWFSIPKPNVIIIVWESGTSKMLDTSVNGVEVAPRMNRMRNEGLWFSDAWASGDRTDKGLPAVLSGYPALPQSSIIRLPNKARKIETLPGLFRKNGYNTSFYYGGEPEFANIKSYLLGAGFDPLIGKSDFDSRDQNSKWGAHDGAVADRLFADLSKNREPFFTTWLTLSSHEPFETPVPTVIPGKDDPQLFLNSLHYTDSILGHFIDRCKGQPWWKNTVVVIVADHGHPMPETGNRLDNFRIPILILGGALRPDMTTRTGYFTTSQLDIASMLSIQILNNAKAFPFSKRNAINHNWAFFTFNNGFGFAAGKNRFLFDNVGRRIISSEGNVTPELIRAGQAMQQVTYQDYLEQ